VSGGAHGIDLAAHRGVLCAGGESISVLGTPVNPEDQTIEIPHRLKCIGHEQKLLVMTAYGPEYPATKRLFALRNQYIVALADAVVIMQGAEDSGTLHTARFATHMQVPIFAMPGDIEDPLAYVSNSLLSRGEAKAYVGPEALVQTLGWRTKQACMLFIETNNILSFLKKSRGRAHFDDILRGLNLSLQEAQRELLLLELDGKIKKMGPEFMLSSS
jgi:DNA processing protein